MLRVRFLLLALIGLVATTIACDEGATVTDPDVQPQFAKWTRQVVGGGELINDRGNTVYMQMSVTDFGGSKGVKGQVQRHTVMPDGTSTYLKFHGVVDVLLIEPSQVEDGSTIVNICGTVTAVQEVGERLLEVGDRFGIKIKDVPDGQDSEGFPRRNFPDCDPENFQGAFDVGPFYNRMVAGDFRVK